MEIHACKQVFTVLAMLGLFGRISFSSGNLLPKDDIRGIIDRHGLKKR